MYVIDSAKTGAKSVNLSSKPYTGLNKLDYVRQVVAGERTFMMQDVVGEKTSDIQYIAGERTSEIQVVAGTKTSEICHSNTTKLFEKSFVCNKGLENQ